MNADIGPVSTLRIGLISDTHGFLDPSILHHFSGVDHILHGGDIGSGRILTELERIAPVTAVLGNNDFGIAGLDHLGETEVVVLAGLRFLVHHIVIPERAAESIGVRFVRERPEVVLFGHTHQRFQRTQDGTLFLNPGYSGKPKFHLRRSVAILEVGPGIGGGATTFIDL
ncbi:MAG: metallophosphoesterase [Pedosphaera sp.]|nr:metallophosphoesterase [Pedosphaera sp.]